MWMGSLPDFTWLGFIQLPNLLKIKVPKRVFFTKPFFCTKASLLRSYWLQKGMKNLYFWLGSLENQKWFCIGIAAKTPLTSLIFKSVGSADLWRGKGFYSKADFQSKSVEINKTNVRSVGVKMWWCHYADSNKSSIWVTQDCHICSTLSDSHYLIVSDDLIRCPACLLCHVIGCTCSVPDPGTETFCKTHSVLMRGIKKQGNYIVFKILYLMFKL